MIYLDAPHKKIILDILQKYPYVFYAYGSRTTGLHRPHSDLDLCFKEPIPLATLAQLKEEFEESDLPFAVDLHDFNRMDPSFQNQISPYLIILCANT